jgi:hypothetical protein
MSGSARVWQQTQPSEAEPIGGTLIAAGILTALYGWLLVRRIIGEGPAREQEKQVARVLCFEAEIVLTVAGILFLVRYHANS